MCRRLLNLYNTTSGHTILKSISYTGIIITKVQTVVESLLYNLWAALFTQEQTVVESLLYNLMAALLIDSMSSISSYGVSRKKIYFSYN